MAGWKKLFEFLYENGFRYVARDEMDTLKAWAFENEPELYEEIWGLTYYDTEQGDVFTIDLDLRCAGPFPVKLNSCMKISDLLTRKE